MTLEEYVKDRWDRLAPQSKRLLGLTDAQAIAFLQTAWEMQYYREQLVQMRVEINELRQEVKRLWPEAEKK
jgi:hypothetical protein